MWCPNCAVVIQTAPCAAAAMQPCGIAHPSSTGRISARKDASPCAKMKLSVSTQKLMVPQWLTPRLRSNIHRPSAGDTHVLRTSKIGSTTVRSWSSARSPSNGRTCNAGTSKSCGRDCHLNGTRYPPFASKSNMQASLVLKTQQHRVLPTRQRLDGSPAAHFAVASGTKRDRCPPE